MCIRIHRPDSTVRRIASAGEVAHAARDVLVQELTASLPEARVIDRVIHAHASSRVITFELLSTEH